MSDKYIIPLLIAVAVLLVLCCTAFGYHSAGAAGPQDSTVAETVEAPAETLTTVALDVPGMTCASCPFIVKKTLKAVDGVSDAEASFETMSATVTFDENKTNIDALLEALKNKGYPSNVAEGQCGTDESMKC